MAEINSTLQDVDSSLAGLEPRVCGSLPGDDASPLLDDRSFVAENQEYWTERSASYSAQHVGELESAQRRKWERELTGAIRSAFPGRANESVSVLEVGTGPGFFSIVLAGAGYRVTGIDYTPAMLARARANARTEGVRVDFRQMNAEALGFADESFDVVVSRNLTWDLPHPHIALGEWTRVLAPGGLLLNYDANWYGYLYDEDLLRGYGEDRANTAKACVKDRILYTDVDAMEQIAREVPLSHLARPAWDVAVLEDFGMSVETDTAVFRRVWSDEELVNHSSTPLFRILARKLSR